MNWLYNANTNKHHRKLFGSLQKIPSPPWQHPNMHTHTIMRMRIKGRSNLQQKREFFNANKVIPTALHRTRCLRATALDLSRRAFHTTVFYRFVCPSTTNAFYTATTADERQWSYCDCVRVYQDACPSVSLCIAKN